MPCYNCADKVYKAIDSIYAQYIAHPFEVICCDDGSTDSTLLVLRRCKKRYPTLKIAKHKKNRGAGAAANTCIKYAQGDLLFRLDADNMLAEPEHDTTNRLVALLDETGCDAAMVENMVLFENEKEIKTVLQYQAENNICDLQHCITEVHNPAMSGNFLFTRASFDRVGGYPEDHGSDTFRFGFELYATGGRVAILPNSFYWHFYNPHGYWWREQRTGNNDIKALETVLRYKHLFDARTQKNLERAVRKETTLFQLIHKKLIKQRQ
jgi:glycosyltransferase involved in cell wall biosynthesis